MPTPVLIHISGEDPVRAEVEEIPKSTDTSITAINPRRRDGKDIKYLLENVVTVIYPMHRVNFIEILPTAEEEKIIGFIRD
jgi:hypothetical protein